MAKTGNGTMRTVVMILAVVIAAGGILAAGVRLEEKAARNAQGLTDHEARMRVVEKAATQNDEQHKAIQAKLDRIERKLDALHRRDPS